MKQRLRVILLLAFTAAIPIVQFRTFALTGAALRTASATSPGGVIQDQTDTVRFIAFGDMGTGDSEQYTLARQMTRWHDQHPYDIALLLGDNIYPDGNPADLPAKFEKPYAELLQRGVHFQASLGNHDVKRGRAAQINYPNFNMGGHAYYSFVKGNNLVEFFALDSNAFDAVQKKWFEEALAASQAQWKIVFFHHPIYSSATTHGSDLALRAKVEPLFVRYGVAAVFCGHDHVYERTKLIRGVQYFVSGAGSGKLRRGDINPLSPFFAAGNDEVSSFMYVEVARAQLSFQAISATSKVLDKGTLTRAPAKAALIVARTATTTVNATLTIPPLTAHTKSETPSPAVNNEPVAERSASTLENPSPTVSNEAATDKPVIAAAVSADPKKEKKDKKKKDKSEKDARAQEKKVQHEQEKEAKHQKEKEQKEQKKKQKDAALQ